MTHVRRALSRLHRGCLPAAFALLWLLPRAQLHGEQLVVELQNAAQVTFVGATSRWDADGNARRPVDPKAKIELPGVDAIARRAGPGKWIFENLPPGRYDLVILARPRIRIEGFTYPPMLEFDPFFGHDKPVPESVRTWITKEIAKSRYYENKVTPLFFGGDKQQVRVFVQLLRDKPTSFDGEFGEQVATLRHEVWQYTQRYGAWSKEKRTRVFDRLLMAKRELRQWTWSWEPRLGGIQVDQQPVRISYELPRQFSPETARGLQPY